MTDKLPDVLPGHWETARGARVANEYAELTRAKLCNGHQTDMETAFDIAMLGRTDLNFEPVLGAAKDRIRWLSAQLAIRTIERDNYLALYSRSVEAITPYFQPPGKFGHLLTLGDHITEKGPAALIALIARAADVLETAMGAMGEPSEEFPESGKWFKEADAVLKSMRGGK